MPRKKKLPLSALSQFGSSEEPDELEDAEGQPELEPEPIAEPAAEQEPVAKPPKPISAKPQRSGVSLEVYLRVSGKRLHQMAGFRRWAINNGLKKLEIKDWRAEYQKFLRQPV